MTCTKPARVIALRSPWKSPAAANLGYRFQQIADIIDATHESDRLRVCFDTEHAFAAGYDLRTDEGYERTFGEFDETIGIEQLAAFHLNDSKKEFNSRVDRHEHIGKGFIGVDAFRRLMNDKTLLGLAHVLGNAEGTGPERRQRELDAPTELDQSLINLI